VIASGIPKRNIIEPLITDQTRWVQTDKIPYRDDEGNIQGIIGFSIEITSRVQAEKALRESEERFRTFMETASDLMHIADKDGNFTYVNEAMARTLGYSREEMIGMHITQALSEETLEKTFKPKLEELTAKGKISLEATWVTKDGKEIYGEIKIVAVYDSDGKFAGSRGVFHDLTERKLAEEALRKSEEKYRRIVETAQEGIWMINAEAKTIYVNQRLAEMFGYTVKEMLGRSALDFIDDSNHEEAKLRIERRKHGLKDQYDFEFKRKDGSVLWATVSGNPMFDDDGQFIGNFSMISDISDRRRTEEALRESEEKYRLLVENANEAIFVAQDEVVKFPNPKAIEMMGYSQEELGKISLVNLVHLEDRDEVLNRHEGRLKGEKLPSTYSFRIINKTSEELWVQLNSAPIIWEGRPATLNFLRDITAQKRLEAQLQRAQKMEAIGTLAGGVAHNFNNLLMGVMGNTSLMLLETDSNHPYYERLKNIEKSVQSGSKLTSQLLGYARKGTYEIKPISLNQLVKETSDTFAMTRKEIRIHRDLDKDLFGINADQGQIEQVLLNLYVNAADAMPGGGDLFLKTMNVTNKDITGKPYEAKPGNYVLVSVTDTGVGMDKKTIERIFDPFFTVQGLAKGTGLGLASVYGIIKAHGGYIDVESKKGQGTTFSIYLPASSEKEVITEKQLPEEILKGKEAILLVDDEDMVLDAGEQMLKKLGYEVLLAEGGREAIELYNKNLDNIAMVLLDMVMPGMGGGEAYDRMKEINPDIKVLLSSGYSIDGQATGILQRGCDGFIQKPFSMKELSQSIRKILDKE
jgi:PAS domain S-box-containing protein